MTRILDAAVLGAGIAGSSLAKALADKGWETLLLDRQSFPRHKVCGEFLSPEAQGTLQVLGLSESIKALGPSLIERIRLIFENGAEINIPLSSAAWGLSRYSLDAALHQAAQQAGAKLQTGTTVTAVKATDFGYSIETKQNGKFSSVEARTVIAAWGANKHAGLPGYKQHQTAKPSYMGVKSHFRGIAMEPVVELYFFRGGYLGLCPVEDGLVNASALLARDSFADAGKTILGIMKAAARRNSRLHEKLALGESVQGSQAAVAPVHLNHKPHAWDQLPLLGDAGAMIPPLCGDGMSMALRSAALCAPLADRYLNGSLTMADWQLAYIRAIKREFEGPLRWGSFLQWLFHMPTVSSWLPNAARIAPPLAQGLVRATRLKPFRM
ncbi:monooxygenase [Paenibacillus sp. FSL A5-0031]|uniref:NAD(P)/FAD-dependent oxidoreductase n=1 Tax=Paenibacillus sp. FSL A5-0031 TaxID=1920420 RepID=UPI00096DD7C5|nr:NAD(P)/FAD-dependent oxidoreductase [Paenibacillus sp. FSL A5-0031]OME77714.1 monooxygenase [Paenibacillus sp. FSL A5-0031]